MKTKRKDKKRERKEKTKSEREKEEMNMKKRNKVISLVLVTSMAMGLVAGCSSGGEKAKEDTKKKTEDSTKLTIWTYTSDTADKGWNDIIDAYSADHPEVEIEFSSFGTDDYESKLSSALSSDMGPDLFATYGWNNLESYMDAGFTEKLDGKLNVDSYTEDALKVVTLDGSIYAAPGAYAGFYTVFYNKDLFEQAGIKDTPTSYDEFIAVCDELKKAGIAPIAMGTAQTEPLLFAWVTTMRGNAADFFKDIETGAKTTLVDAEFQNTVQVLADWANAGYYNENYSGTNYDMQKILFATGQAGMILCSTGRIAEFMTQNPDLNLGAFAYPGVKATYGVRSVEPGLSLNTTSKNKEAAIDFLNYTLTTEAQQMMVDATSGIPVIDGVEPTSELSKEVAEVAEYVSQPIIPLNIAGKNDSNPQDVFTNDIISIVNGDETSSELVEKMNEVWDSEKYVAQFK